MAEEKIFLGYISKSEAADIEPKIERLAGLEELLMIVENNELTTSVNNEIESLKAECTSWWVQISTQYYWKTKRTDTWEIDFSNDKVWLIKPSDRSYCDIYAKIVYLNDSLLSLSRPDDSFEMNSSSIISEHKMNNI